MRRCIIVLLSLFMFLGSLNADVGDTTLIIGQYSGGQDAFEDHIGSQIEFGATQEWFHWRDVYLDTGLIFWNFKDSIDGHNYTLDSLIIPFRIMWEFPLIYDSDLRIGGSIGPHFLIENFDQTELYTTLHRSIFLLLTVPSPFENVRLRYEFNVGESDFEFLNNLVISGVSYRFGVVTRF